MCKKIKIKVCEELGSSTAISTDDGNIIFNIIVGILEKKGSVILDFAGIDLLISAFLNAAIGQLYSRYSSEKLQQSLTVVNMNEDDKQLLVEVIKRAKAYFANPDEFERVISKEL